MNFYVISVLIVMSILQNKVYGSSRLTCQQGQANVCDGTDGEGSCCA